MSAMAQGFSTLTEALDASAALERRVVYVGQAVGERSVSFAALRRRALGVLRHFQSRGLGPGDELILFTNDNEQFVDGFWACLYGGIVPVPIAVGVSDDQRNKLFGVFASLANPHVYTDQGLLQRLSMYAEQQDRESEYARIAEKAVFVEDIADVSTPGDIHVVGPDDRAFIQFSSGSTSAPKGVVLTHGNVSTNVRAINRCAGHRSEDVSLSWMPLTHDMGLIGFHLSMLAAGIEHYIMDTALFSRRPLAWLTKASEVKATILCSPNFGYKHFLKLYESRGIDEIDLSPVRLIYNGAEPISAPLCERFLGEMARFGLKRTAMFPVYGLAEASLAVSFPEPGTEYRSVHVDRHGLSLGRSARLVEAGTPGAVELVCVGRAIDDCELRIADGDDRAVADGVVGHIQIRGGNVTAGYYRADGLDRSKHTGDGWLDTGDLGFVRDGGLVVTGRHKEIIFVNGQNYYPHDIENVVAEAGVTELGKVVAVGARSPGADEDELVVFVLHRMGLDDFLPVANELQRAITEQTGLEVAHSIPIERVPKTTSGKIQRAQLVNAYEEGAYAETVAALDALRAERQRHEVGTGKSAIEQSLLGVCREVVTDRAIDPEDDFFEIGISSLALAEIHERIDELYPNTVDIEDFFEHPTIRALAAHLETRLGDAA